MIPKAFRASVLAVTTATAVAGVGCTTGSLTDGEAIGFVRLAVTVPGGVVVDGVNYQVMGSGITPIAGVIDHPVPGTTTTSTAPTALQPGMYTVTMNLAADATTCAGSAPFTVIAGQSVLAQVLLHCARPGALPITGRLDQCPLITAISAPSVTAVVGTSITVSAGATDLDPGDVLTYSWTASPPGVGVLGPNAATTTFTCAGVGTVQLSIAVSDGICGDMATNAISVSCTAEPVDGDGTIAACSNETFAPASLVASCTGCVDTSSNPVTDGCCSITDAVGQSLCRSASACIRAGACNQGGDATLCFCGTRLATCAQAGQANGPCVAAFTAAAGRNLPAMTTDAPTEDQVLTRFGDPRYALGRAVNIQVVAGAFCEAECGF